MRPIIALVLLLFGSPCAANILENPSFEVGSGNSAAAWFTHVAKGRYEFLVAGAAHSGRRCLAIRGIEAGAGRWYTTDAFLFEGAKYHLSCWVKSEGPATGLVWLPGANISLTFQDTPEWKRVEADLSPKSTGRHGLYLQSHGLGTVFFDDVSITAVGAGASPAGAPAGSGSIATNGAPLAGIVVPDNSGATEGYLAVEARRVLKEMTGVTLPIYLEGSASHAETQRSAKAQRGFQTHKEVNPVHLASLRETPEKPPAGRLLWIGCAPDAGRYTKDLSRVGEEGIVLDVGPRAVVCLGNTPRGIYYAVQEFLYRLGCRWYMPWEGGECIPKAAALELPARKVVHAPSFQLRGCKTIQVYHYPPEMASRHVDTEPWVDWAARNRMNGLKAGYPQSWDYGAIRGHEYAEWSGHTLYAVLPPEKYFAAHPEYYTLVNGKRTATHSSGRASQVCVSNEEVIRHVADFIVEYFDSHPYARRFGVCAEDEPSYWCECPQCKALDTAPAIDWSKNGEGCLDLTDRWIWFINRVADRVWEKHPDRWVHTFAYGSTRELPRKVFPRRNVMIELTWWDRCFKHRMEDRSCPVNAKGMRRLAGWSKLAPIAIYGYLDYHYMEAPGTYLHADSDFYRTVHREGVRYISDEWDTTHLASPLLLNLRARLLWDVSTDVDRFIADFCRRVYGPAAAPAQEYFLGLERAVAEAPSTHVSFNDLEKFTPAVLSRAGACLDRADALAAGDPAVLARLARLRISLKYAEVCILSRRVEKEPALYAPIERLKAEVDGLVRKYNIPILLGAYNLLDTKYKPPVQALAGKRLMELPEQWLFLPDPRSVGEGERWFAKSDFAEWKPISTHAAWEGQGYPGLEGDAWYALKVRLPKTDAARVYLLFEAVDETFKLWINGEFVGQSVGDPGVLWDKPQAVEITGKFRPGEENTLVVKVHDIGYAGGIWKPVWITAAAKGDAVIGQ